MQEEFLEFNGAKQIFQSDRYRLLLASSVALPPRSGEPTGRDRVGGRRLWRTTSPWCFDKGYSGRENFWLQKVEPQKSSSISCAPPRVNHHSEVMRPSSTTINKEEAITGFTVPVPSTGFTHGFVRSPGGTVTSFGPPFCATSSTIPVPSLAALSATHPFHPA
jgi:hypothetical protein